MLEAFQIQMFPYEQLRPDMAEEDYVICVDAQKHSGNITDFVGDEVACIDHHPILCQLNTATRTSAPLGPAPRSSPSIINSFRACRTGTTATAPALWPENGHSAVYAGRDGTGY